MKYTNLIFSLLFSSLCAAQPTTHNGRVTCNDTLFQIEGYLLRFYPKKTLRFDRRQEERSKKGQPYHLRIDYGPKDLGPVFFVKDLAGLATDSISVLLAPDQDTIYMNCRGGGSAIFQAQFCGFDEKKHPCQPHYLEDKRLYWQHPDLKGFYLSVERVVGHFLIARVTKQAKALHWNEGISNTRAYLDPNAEHYQVLLLVKGELNGVAPGEMPTKGGWKLWWER
jgi:hypothetical protein